MCFLSVRAVYELCQGELILDVSNYDYDYVFVIKTNFTLTPAKMFRGTCGYHLSKEDKNCSHLHLPARVYRLYSGCCTQHVAT